MIGFLKPWIINISTTIIFMTAVEMMIPNNKMKKYVKFVLGLILISVLIGPIVKIFDKNFNISKYSQSAAQYFDDKGYEANYDKYKNVNKSNTLNSFKQNLIKTCENKLKERFPENTYNVQAEVEYDKNGENVIIKSLKVGVKDNSIEKVKKVDISTKGNYGNNDEIFNSVKGKAIREYLIAELKIPNENLAVYRTEK